MNRFKISIIMLLVSCLTQFTLAISLTDAQMYLNPDEVPYDFYDRVYLDDLAIDNDYIWLSEGDDIIDADILPVLNPGPGLEGEYPVGYVYSQSDYYQTPNVDYFADITAGDLTVTFLVSGQYCVRVNRTSGGSKIWTVFAETGMLEIGSNKTGASRKISGPSGDLIIVSKGDKTLDQAAKNIQNEDDGSGTGTKKKVTRAKGVDDTISKIKAASKAAGKKIHVEIVGHGAPGMISTNDGSVADGDLIGPDEADIKEFQEAIDDYVEGLSLFSCSSAEGAAGDKLLNLLASSLGWASGYTVPITVEKGYFNIKTTATKNLMLDTDTLVPISDYQMDVDFADFSMSAESIPIEIDGIIYDSGELLFTRDLDYPPEENGVFFDFTDGSVTESLHVLVDCPLFIEKDIPSQKLHFVQSGSPGTIQAIGTDINPTLPTPTTITYNYQLLNESYFEPGQLMETWTFDYQRDFMVPDFAAVTIRDSGACLLEMDSDLPIIREGTVLDASLQPPEGGLPPLVMLHNFVEINQQSEVIGDLDNDFDVDLNDLAIFSSHWLEGKL